MHKNIESIMNPKSIAVVGASSRPGSVGEAVFRNLLRADYKGVFYPVNPRARSIRGVKSYPSLLEIPDEVETAIMVIPAESILPVLEEAAEKGVRGIVVITAGFKEVGGKGVELEQRLRESVAKHGFSLVGPNCLGVINSSPSVCMNASFAQKMPDAGNIAFISQSGALCTAVLDYAAGESIGFSKIISFGNKADVNEIDILHYLKDDPETDVILMYLEDISDGREFIRVAGEISWEAKKPILALKSGRSAEGAKAAASHTGSLAGSDAAYDAIFFQSGIQRVETIAELFDYASAFAKQPLPRGNRIAIVTNAGGPGIMATDAAIRHDLVLSSFSKATVEKLKVDLPPTAATGNPVDVIGDATHERYEKALKEVLLDDNVDGTIVILTPQAMTEVVETAEIVPRVAHGIDKPVLCSFMGIVDVSKGAEYLESHGIPNYNFPEGAVRAMASMVRFAGYLKYEGREFKTYDVDRKGVDEAIREKLAGREKRYLPQKEANEILARYGFPVLKSRLLTSREMIEEAAKEVSFPVAMKIISPDIVHKWDAGGVILKIKSVEEAGGPTTRS